MGQLVPSFQRAARVALSSPNGDDQKPYQASSFKNSTGRSMTSPSPDGTRPREGWPTDAGKNALGRHPVAADSSPLESREAPCGSVQPSAEHLRTARFFISECATSFVCSGSSNEGGAVNT